VSGFQGRMHRHYKLTEELCRRTAGFSKREEATNIECQGGGANIRRRGGVTYIVILTRSSEGVRGLIPVWLFYRIPRNLA
jgi:hypothetical protein